MKEGEGRIEASVKIRKSEREESKPFCTSMRKKLRGRDLDTIIANDQEMMPTYQLSVVVLSVHRHRHWSDS